MRSNYAGEEKAAGAGEENDGEYELSLSSWSTVSEPRLTAKIMQVI